ncbi:MAG: sigma-70 family RNA polymerase sigma factor [Clostridium sp.]|uniref:sigma-70 family RNA polymerase sigma factor n=1 Tax=Clostridium sp. TaxID=1506 RepID=UPI0030549647
MKDIKIKGKVYKMDFEQCYYQFEPLRAKVLKQYWFMPIEKEDLSQEISLNFFRAYETYDINRGFEFMTIAYKTIINAIWKLNNKFHTAKRQSYESVVYLNALAQSADNPNELMDLLIYEDSFEDNLCTNLDFEKLINQINSETEVKIIKLSRCGYTQREIGEMLGYSQVQISRYKRAFKDIVDRGREVS